MVRKTPSLAVFFTAILVVSSVASVAGASTVGDGPPAEGVTAQSPAATGELITCQVTGDCPTPNGTADLDKSGAGVDVLIDGSHRGSTLNTFANALSERGFNVDTKQAGQGEGLTAWSDVPADGLSDYDVVVIPVPERPYTDEELRMIHEYVRDGGSLFAVGQWTSPLQGKAADINAVTDPYGLHFNGETNSSLRNIQDPTNKTVEDYDWRVLLHNTVEHPITEGVETVEYDGVGLNVTKMDNITQSPLLYGDEDTYEFTYSTTEERFERGEEIVGAAAAWDIGANGRVVAFGSQKTLTTYIKDSWQNDHVRTDSGRFTTRTVKWLAGAGHLEQPAKPVVERNLAVKGGETPTNESLVIRNDEVAFTIGTETNGPFGALPGGIYDGAAYGMSEDRIAVSEFAADDFGSWVVYESFETRDASGPDGRAVVTATGHVKENPDVEITTEYVLPAGAKHVWINTTMENTGQTAYPANESESLWSGLALSSEGLSAWLPGIGANDRDRYDPSANPELTEPWAALSGERTTYGVWGAEGSFDIYTAASTWADPWLDHTLEAGETEQVDYAFYVGSHGGTAEMSEYYARQHGESLGTVSGTVETTDGTDVAKPDVIVERNGEPYTYTVGNQNGEYSLKLPAGEYTIHADADGFGHRRRDLDRPVRFPGGAGTRQRHDATRRRGHGRADRRPDHGPIGERNDATDGLHRAHPGRPGDLQAPAGELHARVPSRDELHRRAGDQERDRPTRRAGQRHGDDHRATRPLRT